MNSQALDILNKYFGYPSFRKGQDILIDHILSNRDVLGIMPTAAGKSICFQIPALIKEGVTLVISPLISLMKDQVDGLSQMGIKSAFINSSLSFSALTTIINDAKNGLYKLIYIAPERLENESFYEFITSVNISIIAVDEAHCVSQWGHDFRPSYTKIAKIINQLPTRPIVCAFTATATPEVKQDIIKLLELKNPFTLVNGFDRENLYFEVIKPQDKLDFLLDFLSKNPDKSGIIYASTRKTVDSLCQKLISKGFNTKKYHAGLSDSERSQTQEDFLRDKTSLIVATNAFGMGIDKSNIRFVIHYNMPKNMESYYQEAGRAGRDGLNSECIMLYNPSDIMTNKFLIELSPDNSTKKNDYQKLNEIIDFCNTDNCLRTYILEYFGDENVATECNNCSNCNSVISSTNITLEAQKIFSCIKRMNERFGIDLTTDVLRGSKREKITQLGFDKITTYGIMKDYSKESLKEIISFLIANNYISLIGNQYPVLNLTESSYQVLKGNKDVNIKRSISKTNAKPKTSLFTDNSLFAILKTLRTKIALQENVPPFLIFSDATLNDMCKKYPTTSDKMLKVVGVGTFKLQKFGDAFISAIKEYMELNNLLPCANKTSKKNVEASTKVPTKMITYELYSNGYSIEQIVKERQLTQFTIESHLVECASTGLNIDFNKFIPKEFEPQIIDAINKLGIHKLKILKEALPPEVSYTAIKFVICKYNLSSV